MPVSFDEENITRTASQASSKVGGIIGFLMKSGLVKTKASAEGFLMIVVLVLLGLIAFVVYMNYQPDGGIRYDPTDPALKDQTL